MVILAATLFVLTTAGQFGAAVSAARRRRHLSLDLMRHHEERSVHKSADLRGRLEERDVASFCERFGLRRFNLAVSCVARSYKVVSRLRQHTDMSEGASTPHEAETHLAHSLPGRICYRPAAY